MFRRAFVSIKSPGLTTDIQGKVRNALCLGPIDKLQFFPFGWRCHRTNHYILLSGL